MTNSISDQMYFMSHILPVYKRAAVWDDNLCLIAQGYWGSAYSYSDVIDTAKLYVVGSFSDGACSPRLYRSPPVQELDIMRVLDDIGDYYDNYKLQPHPDKVGVYMDNSRSRQQQWDILVTQNPDCVRIPTSTSPQHVEDAYQKGQEILQDTSVDYYPEWYNSQRGDISGNRRDSNKGPSMKFTFGIDNTHIEEDNVFAYQFPGWPQEAEEWRSRARLWPPQSVVDKVSQEGYQVVLKLSNVTGDMDSPMEHHISFALCERYLAKQRTPVQKLVYLMAKTLFYSNLDLHDDVNPNIDFPSYALKTSMMWMMEQTPLGRWTEDNVPNLLRELLTRLRRSAQNGTLQNYFMIGANVLSNCTPKLLKKAERKISWILSDINKFLQETALYKCNVILYGYSMLRGGTRAYDELVYYCQHEVMNYGLLQAIQDLHKVRATYQRIIEILEKGTGEGLQAKGYLFDEEECFHILKTFMLVHSDAYIKHGDLVNLDEKVQTILKSYSLDMSDLIEDVLCLNKHLTEPEVTILRLSVQWQDSRVVGARITAVCGEGDNEVEYRLSTDQEWRNKLSQGIKCLPGETDVIVIQEGQDISVHKWSSMGDLIEHYVRDLWDNEADRWMPQIYSLTHRDIPEVLIMDFARMLYLLYACDDKRAPKLNKI